MRFESACPRFSGGSVSGKRRHAQRFHQRPQREPAPRLALHGEADPQSFQPTLELGLAQLGGITGFEEILDQRV